MPREQAHFSLATWRNHEISASRRARVSEQSAQTCVEDRDHGQSKAGIAYILPSVTKEFRLILEKTTPDKLSFGSDLSEKIRDAKAVAKIGKDFKSETTSIKDQQKGGPLNSRGLTSKPGNSRSGQGQKSFSRSAPRNMNWTQKSSRQGRPPSASYSRNNNRTDNRNSR